MSQCSVKIFSGALSLYYLGNCYLRNCLYICIYIIIRLETVRSGFVLKRLHGDTQGSHSDVEQTNREKTRKKKTKHATKNPDFTHLSDLHTLPPIGRGKKQTNKQTKQQQQNVNDTGHFYSAISH